MTKYQPLEAHLRRSQHEYVHMTFAEIEDIIGADLPASAFKHRPWWSNNPSNSVITSAWLNAGYKSEAVDMPGRKLMFHRVAPGGPAPDPNASQPPKAGLDGPGGSETGASSGTAGTGFFSRIYGALKGTVTVRPGTDLTAPVDAEWEAER